MNKRLVILIFLYSINVFSQKNINENWIINSEKSFISYQGKHVLHEWVGINNKIKGVLVFENSQPLKIAITANIFDFDSGNSSRDSNSLEILEALDFPRVSFYGESFKIRNKSFDLSGNITFHGIKKLNQIDGVILKRTKKEIVLEGNFEIKPSEYKINLPSFMLIKMEDLLKIKYKILFEKK